MHFNEKLKELFREKLFPWFCEQSYLELTFNTIIKFILEAFRGLLLLIKRSGGERYLYLHFCNCLIIMLTNYKGSVSENLIFYTRINLNIN